MKDAILAAILLREMEYRLKIGVEEKERADSQPIFFDMEMVVDVTEATKSQSIKQTVNYSAVQRAIEQFLENKEYVLVEKAASDVADLLLQKFSKIEEITLICWKPQALQKKNVRNVGIKIMKKREAEIEEAQIHEQDE